MSVTCISLIVQLWGAAVRGKYHSALPKLNLQAQQLQHSASAAELTWTSLHVQASS
jgi:hypothetical protein